MMQIEHQLMLITALAVAFAARRDHSALAAVLWTQLPFWVGSFVFFATSGPAYWQNLTTDILCAVGLLLAAHAFPKWYLIWLCAIFTAATVVDIYAIAFGLSYYVVAHEIMHYTALIIIAGRNYAHRLSDYIARALRRSLAG